ncbi:ATP-dependent zinc metalloprotease FTSH 5, partial [Durusdinium trenchii]
LRELLLGALRVSEPLLHLVAAAATPCLRTSRHGPLGDQFRGEPRWPGGAQVLDFARGRGVGGANPRRLS